MQLPLMFWAVVVCPQVFPFCISNDDDDNYYYVLLHDSLPAANFMD